MSQLKNKFRRTILWGTAILLICGIVSLASEIELHPREILPPIVNKSKALACIHREKEVETMKFIPSEMEKDIEMLINNEADYVTYDKFFRQDYLEGLLEEMLWLEENYKDQFIDSKVKRNFGEEVPDGQYKDYHRYSDVFWLTFIKKEHENHLPHTMYFKEWIWLLRAAINKKLPKGFEVAEIEEQYLHYGPGGKFETHKDTHCNPLETCDLGKEGQHPRLLTWLVFLNDKWTPEDGGTFTVYENWPKMDIQEVIVPQIGKGIIFRADKVHHSADLVNTQKRAVTLFINIRKSDVQEKNQPVINNSDMLDTMKQDALDLAKKGIKRFKSESDIADYIKTEFDSMYTDGGEWHCVVGKSFGSSISPQDLNFVYITAGKLSILLFR